ncbi:MAG: hypothetical protein ACJA2S_001830 [Cyclobacteriaceae bacterium]|jgi:hypothetical protein
MISSKLLFYSDTLEDCMIPTTSNAIFVESEYRSQDLNIRLKSRISDKLRFKKNKMPLGSDPF